MADRSSEPRESDPRNVRVVVVGALLVAAAVVATLVLAPGLGSLPEPRPDLVVPSPTLDVGTVPDEVVELIADDRTHRLAVSGGLDGAVAVIWRELDGNPRYALVTRTADGTTTGQLVEAPFGLTPVPGGWVAMRSYRGYLLAPDGSLTDLPIQAATQPRAGDVQVEGQGRPFLYRPSTGLLAPAVVPVEADATWLNPEGHWIGYDREAQRIASSTGQGVAVPDDTAYVVFGGREGIVVGVLLGERPGGSLRVTGALVSRDGGRRWEDVELRGPEIETFTSLAVLPSGTVVLATQDQGLYAVHGATLAPEAGAPALVEVTQTGTTTTYGWDSAGVMTVNTGGRPDRWERASGSDYL